ncbi:hypothetical protein GCM10017044_14720 [Kordiimonas sediminis]|uniref:Cytochrome c domain-containing protein n=1 Tax=Kordiimonas sediminis TaxID=1735581 RepID=A0A919E779_9PROT|nr:parallel beta-helix domain-containing protein [Kordiimonas sediminis]GHF20862.1 hypothetical protein GCM10017044_14720 [Kordiimonas sediminis]
MKTALKWLLPVIALAVGYYFGVAGQPAPKDREVTQTVSTNPLFTNSGQSSLAAGSGGSGTIHEVREGQLIQDAVIAAKPGDIIQVYPGTYHETVYVDKDDITLSGVVIEGEWPTLDGDSDADGKSDLNDAILYSGNNFLVENFRIQRFKGNGIMGQAGNNFIIRNNIIDDAGVYGIFPQLGKNGLISGNVVSQIADAAIYVGMSDNIDVIANEVFDSVAGIEIENSRHALVEGNYTYNNTGGILAFITPGLPIKTTYDVIIRKNFVLNNNHENFGAPGSTVSNIPPGTGILIMAADDVIVEDNIISGNDNAGITITDLNIFGAAANDPDSEPNSDRVTILTNVMHNNGNNPVTDIKALALANMSTRGPDIIDTEAISGPKGEGKCIVNGSRYRTIGLDNYGACDQAATMTASISTKTLPEPAAPYALEEGDVKEDFEKRVGKRGYYAVCTGCHAFEGTLIGPPVSEIQAIYEDEPEALADYINKPFKKRLEAPEMPPQNYLGRETQIAIAKYILSVDNSGK